MGPAEAFDIYRAIRLHFESEKYDAVKYNFKLGGRLKDSSRDHFMFERLAKKFTRREDLIDFIVAYVVANGKFYVSELFGPKAMQVYTDWQRRRDSFNYQFRIVMNQLAESHGLDDLLSGEKNRMPKLVCMWSAEPDQSITQEMIVVIDMLTGFLADHDKKTSDKIFWEGFYLKARKYRSFLTHIDKDKARQTIINAFAGSKPLRE